LDIPLEALYDFKQFIDKNFSILGNCNITGTRLCWYTDSFDGNFFMCRVPQQSNLFLATGGSGHAFKFLPVLGTIMLDVLNGVKTEATMRFAWREGRELSGVQEQSRSGSGVTPNLSDVEMAGQGDLAAAIKVSSKL
jgi:sarcosine oxidase/L-pipecolate oxidase